VCYHQLVNYFADRCFLLVLVALVIRSSQSRGRHLVVEAGAVSLLFVFLSGVVGELL
jgi:hypothetical protein